MLAATNGQQASLKEFIEQLPEMIAENEKLIADFEKNDARATGEGKDMASRHIEALRQQNEKLRRFIKDMEPAEFQKQVR